MAETLSPNPEETRIESEELAHEMAKAEVPIRERIAEARTLGVSEEALKPLGIAVDERGEVMRKEYENAMAEADKLIVQAIKSVGEHGLPMGGSVEVTNPLVIEALRYRLNRWDEKHGFIPKNPKITLKPARDGTAGKFSVGYEATALGR